MVIIKIYWSFLVQSRHPRWVSGKESTCNAGDTGLIPGSGRPLRGGNGNPLQCSCLENPRDGEPIVLPSMGSHRVGHDWSDLAAAAVVKNLPANTGDEGDTDSIPGSGRPLGGGNTNPFQYSWLRNSMDRGVWWATVQWTSEVAQSCSTLCNPMDCSLPGSSIHGIFQAIVLEWGAIAFSANLSCC